MILVLKQGHGFNLSMENLLLEKAEELSVAEQRVSCMGQRLRTCREYIDREGVAQQSSIIDTPRYHKRYILPVGETIKAANLTNLKYRGCNLEDEDDWNQFRNSVRATLGETPSSSFRNGRSISPALRPSRLPGTFSFGGTTPKKDLDRRSVSPHRFPLLRSGSLSTTPKSSRPTTPNSAMEQQQQRHPASCTLQFPTFLHLYFDELGEDLNFDELGEDLNFFIFIQGSS